jgi:hypothetical protein
MEDKPKTPIEHNSVPTTKEQTTKRKPEEVYSDDIEEDYDDPYDFVAGSNLTRSKRGKRSCYSSKHVRIAMSRKKL